MKKGLFFCRKKRESYWGFLDSLTFGNMASGGLRATSLSTVTNLDAG